jgi:hypothetical protein
MTFRVLLLCAVALLVSSCIIESENPLYLPDEFVQTREALSVFGQWELPKDGNTDSTASTVMNISAVDTLNDPTIRVVSQMNVVYGRFAQIDDELFMDLIMTDQEGTKFVKPSGVTKGSGRHFILRCRTLGEDKNQLELSCVDPSWLTDYLKNHPGELSYKMERDDEAGQGQYRAVARLCQQAQGRWDVRRSFRIEPHWERQLLAGIRTAGAAFFSPAETGRMGYHRTAACAARDPCLFRGITRKTMCA